MDQIVFKYDRIQTSPLFKVTLMFHIIMFAVFALYDLYKSMPYSLLLLV